LDRNEVFIISSHCRNSTRVYVKEIVAMEMDHEDDDYEPNNEDIEDTSPYIL